jgi:hypothetical protein
VKGDTADMLRAWAECVARLIAAAPIKAVTGETGIGGGHSTPPERRAIRDHALGVVQGWLDRDLRALAAVDEGLDVRRLRSALLDCVGLLPPERVTLLRDDTHAVLAALGQSR